MLSIYPLLITPLLSLKHLLLVAICVADLPTVNYPFGIFQAFIASGHCVVDIPSAYYPFGIFQTFITSGHCIVDLPTANYPFGIYKHVLLVDIVLSIYPLLITRLVSSNIYY
jgi:uncharacterized protein (DUF3820 family)